MLSDIGDQTFTWPEGWSLNAPFGARCFLTGNPGLEPDRERDSVLMHRLALGAFGRYDHYRSPEEEAQVLMHLMARGAF